VTVAASAYYGRDLRTALPAAGAAAPTYHRFARLRLGADAQTRVPVPGVGDLLLRAELLWGQDESLSFSGTPADPCRDATSLGWYATAIQYFGSTFALAARVDRFDPARPVDASCPAAAASRADRVTTIGVAALVELGRSLRATIAYEAIDEQKSAERDNDALTMQLQTRF
jgi:hypothetical protein